MAERVVISIAGEDAGGKALIRDVIKALQDAERAETKTAQGARELGNAGNSAARQLSSMESTLGRITALLGAREILQFTKAAIDQADAMHDLAQKTGVQVEQLSILDFAAKRAGLSSEDLAISLRFFAKTLTELRSGSKEAAESFAAIGLGARELEGLSLDQALLVVANAMDKYADGAGKAADAQRIFGRSGSDLIPLFNDLAGNGFAKVTAEAKKLGAVISTEAADAADQFNDALGDLQKTGLGLARDFAASVLPALTDFVKLISESAAKVPEDVKIIVGTMLLIETGAIAAGAGVALLSGALTALLANPIAASIIALGLLAGAIVGVNVAHEHAADAAAKAAKAQSDNQVQASRLAAEYTKLATAIDSGTLKGQKLSQAKDRLKAITDALIKVSPEYRDALAKEGQSATEAAAAVEKLTQKREADLRAEFDQAKGDVDQLFARRRALIAELEKAGFPRPEETPVVQKLDEQIGDAQVRASRLESTLFRIDQAKQQLNAPPKTKPDVVLPDPALIAARLAAQKQALDAENAIAAEHEKKGEQQNQQAFDRGLIDLQQYFASRRAILESSIAREEAQLAEQKRILEQQPVTTKAEDVAKRAAIADVDAKIVEKRIDGQRQLAALDEDERQKQLQLAAQLLGFEDQLRGSRKRTADESKAQIDAQLAAVELALDHVAGLSAAARQAVLNDARQTLTDRATVETLSADVDRIFSQIDNAKTKIDAQVRAGLISQTTGEKAIAIVEQSRVTELRDIATQILEIGKRLKDDGIIQAAEAITAHIDSLGRVTDQVRERFRSLSADIRSALQQDLANFLGSGLNQVFNDAGQRSQLNALEEQARRARDELQALMSSDLSPEAEESAKRLRTEIEGLNGQIEQAKENTHGIGDAFIELAKNAVASVQRILGELARGRDRAEGRQGSVRRQGRTGTRARDRGRRVRRRGRRVSAGAARTQAAAGTLAARGWRRRTLRRRGHVGTSAPARGIRRHSAHRGAALQAAAAALAARRRRGRHLLGAIAQAGSAPRRVIGLRERWAGARARLGDVGLDPRAALDRRVRHSRGRREAVRRRLLRDLNDGIRVPRLRPFDRIPRFAEGGLVLPDRSDRRDPRGSMVRCAPSSTSRLISCREIKTRAASPRSFHVLASNRGRLPRARTPG
jgi:hypothetical protein